MNGSRPVLAFSSRIIKSKQDQHQMALHRQRMRRIKPSVDNARPRSMRGSRRVNRKKEQMDRDRAMEIEAQNHLLISRILDESHADRKLRRAVYGEPRRNVRSLNTTTRRKELERINKANKVMLSRIISTESTMRRDVWESDAEHHDKMLAQLAQNSIHNKRGASRGGRRPGSAGSSKSGGAQRRPGTAGSARSARRPGTAGSKRGSGRGGKARSGERRTFGPFTPMAGGEKHLS